ncbi:MAG: proton-conducting transporter membrane subunit [Armatimonadota bacterium]|nr:hypothetical protein [Armatimonadota bacterium]MCX7776587.1 proton-conducting transporter membrane subunit [Armatimonadota bacterium]MDW8025270.1 proton-conducting transporter membrane subunit [Armatimonadota bacterium]
MQLSQEIMVFTLLGIFLIGAFLTAVTSSMRRLTAWMGFVFAFLGSGLCIALAANTLYALTVEAGRSYLTLPILNASFQIRVDALSSLFLIIIGLLGMCVALYSVGYITHERYSDEHLIRYYPFLMFFLAGMVGVVVTWDMFYFLVFWEVMTLASYVLVVFEKRDPTVLRAGLKYFVMTHVGTTCIVTGVIIIWLWCKALSFDSLKVGMDILSSERPRLLHIVLLMLFVGFATKAALFPFGDWLPDAHPAAPSAISSLLSGVMIKMGIYGMLRTFVWMMPSSPHLSIWGLIIAFFGALTLVVCSTAGLFQNDSKRLLAFSSMSQIGYICVGIGVGIGFLRISPAISTLGFIAGLYHVFNHACMKGLLFLNAGSVLIRSGKRDMNLLGGLWRFMPTTALTALIASLAISGIPPLNGFVSKWMIYHASIMSGLQAPVYLAFSVAAIFISVITLAMFAKFMGAIFIGLPSKLVSQIEGKLSEVDWTMTIPQVVLAIMCVVLGLFPGQVVLIVHRAVEAMRPEFVTPINALFPDLPLSIGICVGEGISGAFSPLIFVLALLMCMLIPYALYKLSGTSVRVALPWACGEPHSYEELRYRSSRFYLPFQRFMSFRIGQKRITTLYPTLPKPKAPWLTKLSILFDVDRLYEAVIRVCAKACEWFSATHAGVPQLYVLWMVAGVVIAILLLYLLS